MREITVHVALDSLILQVHYETPYFLDAQPPNGF
jgi:hypothetical protein